MATGRYDFCLGQGTDATVPFRLKDATGKAIDLSGYRVRMQLRTHISDPDAVDTLTSENGRITIDPLAGKFELTFPNQTTDNYPAQCLVYDIEIVSPGDKVTRIVAGKITVTAGVTRV